MTTPAATTSAAANTPTDESISGVEHDLLALVLKHVDAHVFMKDAAGRYLYANPKVCETLQHPLEEILGHTDAELLPAAAAAELMAFDRQVLATNAPLRREETVITADGTTRNFLSEKIPIRQADGTAMLIGFSTEITELRQQQEVLRISEERHRFLAENARDVIWTMEPDGQVSYVSPSVEAVRGLSAEEAMAQPLDQIHPPDSLGLVTRWWGQMQADVAAGRPPDNFREELAYYRKDGSLFWTEVMAYPLLHPDGSLAQVVGVTRDISERKRAQEEIEKASVALAVSEEHYRLLSSNLYDTILHMTDEGVVTWVSPSLRTSLGYDPQDWIGHPVTDFLVPEDANRAHANIGRCIIRNEPVIARYTAHDKQGRLRHSESYATPYRRTDGTRDGIVVSFHLIDTQVAIEKELERRARTDELTSLLNRREVFERLHDLTGPHHRTGQQLAVLFCDLDKFKDVNDTHGHRAGDEVLAAMAARLRASLRNKDDLAARVGGDELMIVLHGVHDEADAVAVAEKLRTAAAEPIPTIAGPIGVTMSIGVALAHPDETTEQLISRADTAMYQAKQTGRNQVIPVR